MELCGKRRRLARIRPAGRAVVLALDHGVTFGPLPGINDISQVLRELTNVADAVVLHRGAIMNHLPPDQHRTGLVMHLSAGTSLRGPSGQKALVGTVEDAVRLGADAVSVQITFGADQEQRALRDLAAVASSCLAWAMPLLVMAYVEDENPARVIHATRAASELGADLVKVSVPPGVTAFEHIARSSCAPLLLAGGVHDSDETSLLKRVRSAMGAGFIGVCIGRAVFQASSPLAILAAVRDVVRT